MKNSWISVLVVIIICCACSALVGSLYYFLIARPAQSRAQIRPLMINASDLPADWSDDHYGSQPFVEGASAAINLVYDYYYPGDARSFNALSHEIILFPDEQAAARSFNIFKQQWLTHYSDDVTLEFNFKPHRAQDTYEYKCTDGSEPGHHKTICYFLQQHGRYMIFYFMTFDDKALTAAQVDTILTRLDARLP